MARKSPLPKEQEQALMSRLWNPDIADRPDRFVIAAYPWGMEGTALAQHDGPRRWQLVSLREIGEHIKA